MPTKPAVTPMIEYINMLILVMLSPAYLAALGFIPKRRTWRPNVVLEMRTQKIPANTKKMTSMLGTAGINFPIPISLNQSGRFEIPSNAETPPRPETPRASPAKRN